MIDFINFAMKMYNLKLYNYELYTGFKLECFQKLNDETKNTLKIFGKIFGRQKKWFIPGISANESYVIPNCP